MSDHGFVLSKLLSTDSEGDGQGGSHLDGDTAKQDDVVKTTAVCVVAGRVADEDFEKDEDANDNQAGRPDMSEIGLQVASQIIVLVNQRRNKSEETVGTCSAGNTEDDLCNWIQLKAVNVLFVSAWM